MCIHRSLTHRGGAYEQHKSFRSAAGTSYSYACGSTGCPSLVLPAIDKATRQSWIDAALAHSSNGYNRTKPGSPQADTFVFAKELWTDGVPTIPMQRVLAGPIKDLPTRLKAAIKDFAYLGSEYLNVVFGWKPFVNDIRKLYKLTKNLDREIRKLIHKNGKRIRRRVTLVDTRTTTQTTQTFPFAYGNVYGGNGLPNSFGGAKTYYSKVVTQFERVWYSACFKYWIPDVVSLAWNAKATAVLFGALPSPGALYDALPWSWLLQWFFDVGSVLHTFDPVAVQNLVQLYGYTMRHTGSSTVCTSHVSYPAQNTSVYKWSGCDLSFSSIYRDEQKVRAGGWAPFGPGSDLSKLTAYQYSILAALGLSRFG